MTTTNSLTFRESSWAEFKQTTDANYAAWGRGIPMETYWQREVDSKAVVTGHRPWALFKDASGETYQTEALYCRVDREEFKLEKAKAQSVASVFVEEADRGKGYATEFMKRLNWQCRDEGSDFTDLYSDVDPRIYEKCGWHTYPADSVEIDVANYVPSGQSHAKLQPITENGLDAVVQVAINNTEVYFREQWEMYRSMVDGGERPSILFGKVLTKSQILWQIKMIDVYATHLNIQPYPREFGAWVENTTASPTSYVLWAHDLRDGHLNVLTIASSSVEDFKLLMDRVVQEAKTYNLKDIMIWWNPTKMFTLEHLESLGLSVTTRNGSVPMVCSWIPIDPESSTTTTSRVDTTKTSKWINLEKFAWV
eukprot:gene2605-2991_t